MMKHNQDELLLTNPRKILRILPGIAQWTVRICSKKQQKARFHLLCAVKVNSALALEVIGKYSCE